MTIIHFGYSDEDLALIAVLGIVIVFSVISIAITAEWLLEILRSAKDDR